MLTAMSDCENGKVGEENSSSGYGETWGEGIKGAAAATIFG